MKKERWNAIDYFRGLAVLRLIIFHGFQGFLNEPWWMKHSYWEGYKIADLTTPMFLFATGLSYALSLKKRVSEKGPTPAVINAVRRGLKLIAIGSIGAMLSSWEIKLFWGTLEVVGGCCLFTLPFIIFLSPKARYYAAGTIIFLWLIIQQMFPEIFSALAKFNMGGPLGVPALSSLVMIGSAISESHSNENIPATLRRLGIISLLSFVSAWILLSVQIQSCRILVNSTFILLSLGIVCAIFPTLIISEKFLPGKNILAGLGRNAFFLYLLSATINQILLHIFTESVDPTSLYCAGSAEILISLSVAAILHRRKKYFSI